jgi:hypothetical protein
MKVKTQKLSGPALDWAVAKCEGRDVQVYKREYGAIFDIHVKQVNADFYEPSTRWSQGGPIVERERINILYFGDEIWQARMHEKPETHGCTSVIQHYAIGHTPLAAAMRTVVASKLGEEVDIPDELVKEKP